MQAETQLAAPAAGPRIADQNGFVVHPRRWVVERTFAWLGRNHRLTKNLEATIASAIASYTPPPPYSSRAAWHAQDEFQHRL